MAIPTISAAMVGLRDPDGHRLAVQPDGLTLVISPLWTHDWRRDPEASEEINEANRRAMVDRSRAQLLAQMQSTQIGYSYTVSQVVRDHPERAVRIPNSNVRVVVMPPERERTERRDSSYGDDSDDDYGEVNYGVAVLDGTGYVDAVQDGPTLLRQAHVDTGRPHSIPGMWIRGMSRRREDPWNGRALAAGEAVPDHLLEAVAVIGELYLIQQRPSIGVSASLERAVEAVRALGGDSAALLERVLARGRVVAE